MKYIPSLMLITLLLSMGCTSDTEHKESGDVVRIGFCPTMQDDAFAIATSIEEDTQLFMYSSAAEVLQLLHQDVIDIAIVGRKAYRAESTGLYELQTKPGYTLIGVQRQDISYESLLTLEIHTATDSEVVRNLFPPSTEIIFHESYTDALQEGMASGVVLIPWAKYDDEPLVVPYQDGKKIYDFRTPFIYSKQRIAVMTKL